MLATCNNTKCLCFKMRSVAILFYISLLPEWIPYAASAKSYHAEQRTYSTKKPPNYPEDIINQIFADYQDSAKIQPEYNNFSTRNGKDPKYLKNDCHYDAGIKYIYTVKDKQKKTRIVVQHSHYNQSVYLSECIRKNYFMKSDGSHIGNECFSRFFIPSNTKTGCQEKMKNFRLHVLPVDYYTMKRNITSKDLQAIFVELPINCVCKNRAVND